MTNSRIKVVGLHTWDSEDSDAREQDAWRILDDHPEITDWRGREEAIRELDFDVDDDVSDTAVAALLVEQRAQRYYRYDRHANWSDEQATTEWHVEIVSA